MATHCLRYGNSYADGACRRNFSLSMPEEEAGEGEHVSAVALPDFALLLTLLGGGEF